MGEIACRLADRVIVTNDNPRSEDPLAIAEAILAGCGDRRAVATIELDRAAAVVRAIDEAGAGDVVVIAGKGHERYQIIGKERRAFDDRAVARDALRARGYSDE
jgi:UDP-N-acetylmuramoyl-L-alanyl-D-glutamate--2,6-diaminopimelate ligase